MLENSFIVPSPGSLWKGDSLPVWPSQWWDWRARGSEGFETRERSRPWWLDKGDWDPEVSLSQQHRKVQRLLYWNGWVLLSLLQISLLKYMSTRSLYVQMSACSVALFQLTPLSGWGELIFGPSCSLNIENTVKVQRCFHYMSIFWAFDVPHAEHQSFYRTRIGSRSFLPFSQWNRRIKALLPCPLTGGQVVQLIMEYLPLGSLRDYLPKRKLGVPQCLMFAQQICMVSWGGFAGCANHLDFLLIS